MQHKAVFWCLCFDRYCSGLICGEYSLWVPLQLLKAFIILLSCKIGWCIHTVILVVAVHICYCAAYSKYCACWGSCRTWRCVEKRSAHLGIVSWKLCVLCSPFMVRVLEKPKCPFCHLWLMAVLCRIVTSACLRPWWDGGGSSWEVGAVQRDAL